MFANVSDVPEPTTYALMGAGLGALAFFRRRK
ncbi:MAG: PEP-CTERM sorting domain-containing protein [Acidobacteriota bacterium]